MKYLIFSMYDVKAKVYTFPMFFHRGTEMMREFEDWCNDKSMVVGRHPEDYTLFEIGTFDQETCAILLHESKVHVASGIECVRSDLIPFHKASTQPSSEASMPDETGLSLQAKQDNALADALDDLRVNVDEVRKKGVQK